MPANRATVSAGATPHLSRHSRRRRGRSHASKRSGSVARRTSRRSRGVDAEVQAEMSAHHLADGDDQRPARVLVLAALQREEREVGRVEGLAGAEELAHQRAAVLEEVVFGRGGVQAALRIEHVQAGHLVEADGDVAALRQGQLAADGGPEEPRPQEARAGRQHDRVIVDVGRQGGRVPAAGVQVQLVPVGGEAAGQAGDVGLAPPAAGQNAVETERDVHGDSPPFRRGRSPSSPPGPARSGGPDRRRRGVAIS